MLTFKLFIERKLLKRSFGDAGSLKVELTKTAKGFSVSGYMKQGKNHDGPWKKVDDYTFTKLNDAKIKFKKILEEF